MTRRPERVSVLTHEVSLERTTSTADRANLGHGPSVGPALRSMPRPRHWGRPRRRRSANLWAPPVARPSTTSARGRLDVLMLWRIWGRFKRWGWVKANPARCRGPVVGAGRVDECDGQAPLGIGDRGRRCGPCVDCRDREPRPAHRLRQLAAEPTTTPTTTAMGAPPWHLSDDDDDDVGRGSVLGAGVDHDRSRDPCHRRRHPDARRWTHRSSRPGRRARIERLLRVRVDDRVESLDRRDDGRVASSSRWAGEGQVWTHAG